MEYQIWDSKIRPESHGNRTREWMRWRRSAAIVNYRPILSSERMLYKDYDRRCSIEKKNSGRESQGARRQEELWFWLQESIVLESAEERFRIWDTRNQSEIQTTERDSTDKRCSRQFNVWTGILRSSVVIVEEKMLVVQQEMEQVVDSHELCELL
jgi:hypothetical protein